MAEASQDLKFSQFTHRILVHPLGLLYGSKGRFLSPENLVGRSGFHFPPDPPTLSGLYAAHYQDQSDILGSLLLAGPFWAKSDQADNCYVPTPFHCWVEDGHIQYRLIWQDGQWQPEPSSQQEGDYKYRQEDTWVALKDWEKLRSPQPFAPIPVQEAPWKPIPHLHPRLRDDERHSVGKDNGRGSLFLEYGIQLDPEV
ncbi:MAG: CRISPR-associated protein Cmr3, partial [Leptolyngbyaceae cyanobacterium SM2_5_2]|nr:CRISPR-associated protein Cmr3 [Leptolyngbyaceae cyanobacterium SM2_5_2]